MDRVGSTLKKMDGILKYDVNAADRTLLITFDERVTAPERIVGQLAEAGYSISGKPQLIQ